MTHLSWAPYEVVALECLTIPRHSIVHLGIVNLRLSNYPLAIGNFTMLKLYRCVKTDSPTGGMKSSTPCLVTMVEKGGIVSDGESNCTH